MREIKFRARHKESGTWDYGSSETKLEDCSSVPLRTFWEWVQIGKLDPKTVGEFTGLKDKNGKEIYEGDVISYPAWVRPKGSHKQTRAVVIWHIDGYAGKVKGEFAPHSLAGNWNKSTVIGNIYENPELLKEEM